MKHYNPPAECVEWLINAKRLFHSQCTSFSHDDDDDDDGDVMNR